MRKHITSFYMETLLLILVFVAVILILPLHVDRDGTLRCVSVISVFDIILSRTFRECISRDRILPYGIDYFFAVTVFIKTSEIIFPFSVCIRGDRSRSCFYTVCKKADIYLCRSIPFRICSMNPGLLSAY